MDCDMIMFISSVNYEWIFFHSIYIFVKLIMIRHYFNYKIKMKGGYYFPKIIRQLRSFHHMENIFKRYKNVLVKK